MLLATYLLDLQDFQIACTCRQKKSFDPRKTISPRASIEITAPSEADDAI